MSSVERVERLLKSKHVRGLCRMLDHRDAQVSRRAAQVLGELRDPRAVRCLRDALRRASDEYVIRYSITALQQIAAPDAIDALTAAMFGDKQRTARLAQQALALLPDPQAQAAIRLQEVLFRNDWDGLASLGEKAHRPLMVALHSPQYHHWPSGKRKQALTIATRLGLKSPGHSREMLDMGLFVGGVHTMGDLLRGLNHRTPEVRIAAAEKIALSGRRWAANPLYRRFRRELGSKGERSAALAIARAMTALGDSRAINLYKDRLHHGDGTQAAEAARALADIGAPEAVLTLFWFAADPPPPPAYRNVPTTLSALASIGPPVVETLHSLFAHDDPKARRLLVEVVARSRHSDLPSLLAELAADSDEEVQHAALDALADLNTPEAADTLLKLAGQVPERWVTRALASITDPDGPRLLRTLVPDLTSLSGALLDDDRQPRSGAHVQILKEHDFGGTTGWDWQAASARATTDEQGRFALSLLTGDPQAKLRIKVTLPSRQFTVPGETFTADYDPIFGAANVIEIRIDRFFNRLVITRRLSEPFP